MSIRALAIFALPALAVFVIFVLLGFVWWPLAAMALPLALGLAFWLSWRAGAAVLVRLDARPLGQSEGARIMNTLDRLCLTSGIEQPDVKVVDSAALNLATVSGRRKTLVATSSLLSTLGPMEMEGVVAHALSKIANGSARYETMVASLPWAVLEGQRRLARQWDGGDDGLIQFDTHGVGLTRYPPGLRAALERLSAVDTEVAGAEALGTAWLVPPAPRRTPIVHRIEVLGEL